MPKDRYDKNEVGAGWNKESSRGPFISLALDLDDLLEMTGGATGKVTLFLFPIDDTKKKSDKAPDHRLKYPPAKGTRTTAPTPMDDDIPF
jgi:uncharacterized protein (DUF736 family)